MSKFHLPSEGHERSFLRGELESLGLSPIRIDQLTNNSNDNNELSSKGDQGRSSAGVQ